MLRTATWVVRGVALVVIALETFTGHTAHGVTLAIQAVAFGVGAVLVLVWGGLARRQALATSRSDWPVWMFGAMAVCAAPGTSTDGGALIGFGFMAAIGGGSDLSVAGGWVVTGLGAVAITGGALMAGAGATATVGSLAVLLFGLIAGSNRRSYRLEAEQAATLLTQAEQLRAEQRQVAVLDERNRIAREIHDVLAHSLGALSIQVQTARALLSDQRDIDRSLVALDTAQRMVADGLTETRRAVLALRSDAQPLATQLADLADTHRDRHHTAVTVDIHGEPRVLAPEADLALLRTAQESLVNAAKHSAGEPVTACLDYGDGRTTLTITNPLSDTDDGTRRFGTVDGGYGLMGMRERLLLLGGSLTAASGSGQWAVTAEVPQ